MAITLHGGERVLITGDSITAGGWFEVAGGLRDQINALTAYPSRIYGGTVAGGGTVATLKSGAVASSVLPASIPNSIIVTNTAVPGRTTTDIAGDIPNTITNHAHDFFLMLIGINDVLNSFSSVTYTANLNTILTAERAAFPSAQIALVSVLVMGEHWTSGPLRWGPNTGPDVDAAIDAFNVVLQQMCVTYNCTYIDMRSPLLIWESQNNTPEPGVQNGPFAGGGPHPFAGASQVLMGNWGIGSFNVSHR
jgi:lysophospholipase L1-like esterase